MDPLEDNYRELKVERLKTARDIVRNLSLGIDVPKEWIEHFQKTDGQAVDAARQWAVSKNPELKDLELKAD